MARRSPAGRPFRRVALVLGIFMLVEAGAASVGVLSRRFPNSGLPNFVALKNGGS